jgi:hypothetical protein
MMQLLGNKKTSARELEEIRKMLDKSKGAQGR